MSRVVSENVLIKAEYVLDTKQRRRLEPNSGEIALVTDSGILDGLSSGKRKLDEETGVDSRDNKKDKVSLKNRHQDSHPKKEDRLCQFVCRGEQCPFSGSCAYNHDVVAYLAKKEDDIDATCFQFEQFGYCPNGLMCRFGNSHLDRESGANLKKETSNQRMSINVLAKDAQLALRKKIYEKGLPLVKTYNQKGKKKGGTTVPAQADFNPEAFPVKEAKLVDFANKIYIAPLTTVGNLPFRRILKEYGADITCGEMAMANNIVGAQASEWALLRRHQSEDCFGIQIAGGYADTMEQCARVLNNETSSNFVDLNSACPIDVVCNKGCGSSLMVKQNRLFDILDGMHYQLKQTRSLTIKIRTGWSEKNPIAHELIPQLQTRFHDKMSAIMLHGRSRLQRYSKMANWEYILQAAQSQNPNLRRIPIVGNGDILSWNDFQSHQHMIEENMHKLYIAKRTPGENVNGGVTTEEIEGNPQELMGLCNTAMLARGALIKPWLPKEIKEQRVLDIPATERLEIIKKFCNYGLEHWGSDQQGVNNTRRFLLEWMSFLHRYVPVGILEQDYPQVMNQRPPSYVGRNDLETMLSSASSEDWIKISEMFLGNVPKDYSFIPKHKSNAYSSTSKPESGEVAGPVGGGGPESEEGIAGADADLPEG